MPAFSAIHRRKARRRAEEAAASQAEFDRLGPPPAPPPGALYTEAYAQAAAQVARSEYTRRRARPFNAITGRPAGGLQQGIRRPTKPGVY